MKFTEEYYNNISYLVKRYVPDFIVNDYPLFYEFIETYYEWAQQNDKYVPWNIVKNIENWTDIDTTIDEFVKYFEEEFIQLPGVENKALYIKHLNEILQSKGSTKTIEFFIKLLTGQTVDVYYPNRYLMKSSDAVWKQYNYVYLPYDSAINYGQFISTIITGVETNHTAIIENVEIYNDYIGVKLSKLSGDFLESEKVILQSPDTKLIVNIIPTLSNIAIQNPGNNYKIGDELYIKDNSGFKAFVNDIYSGSITSVELVNGGSGYHYGDIIEFECSDKDDYYTTPIVRISDVDTSGSVTKLEIVYAGYGMKSLPELSRVITENGNGLIIKVYSNYSEYNKTPIGGIKTLSITTPGIRYESDLDIEVKSNYGYDFKALANRGSVYHSSGSWVKAGSFLSDVFILQDSYYWQEYSYVLNISSNLLNTFANVFKKILHPAGFIYFTNVVFDNYISLRNKLKYIDSELKVWSLIERELNNYVELIAYSDRIKDDSVLKLNYNKKLNVFPNKKLEDFKRVGGNFVQSELTIATPITIRFNSYPYYAKVYVNDNYIGYGGTTYSGFPGETINIKIKADGFDTYEENKYIISNETIKTILNISDIDVIKPNTMLKIGSDPSKKASYVALDEDFYNFITNTIKVI